MRAGVTDVGAVNVPTSANVAPNAVGSAVVIKLGVGAGDEPTALDEMTNRPDLPPVVPVTGVAEKGIQKEGAAPHAAELPSARMMTRARMRHRFFMLDPSLPGSPKFAVREQ